jgi:hypothetical protein
MMNHPDESSSYASTVERHSTNGGGTGQGIKRHFRFGHAKSCKTHRRTARSDRKSDDGDSKYIFGSQVHGAADSYHRVGLQNQSLLLHEWFLTFAFYSPTIPGV